MFNGVTDPLERVNIFVAMPVDSRFSDGAFFYQFNLLHQADRLINLITSKAATAALLSQPAPPPENYIDQNQADPTEAKPQPGG
ncbi:MAG: hypothetical protein WEB00_14490 [Dehalococcoidia bacterium]